MPSLYDFIGQQLQWKKPRIFTNTHELRAGEQVLASLRRVGFTQSNAVGEIDEQQWSFQKEGFWKKRIVVHQGAEKVNDESVIPLASIQPRANGNGLVTFRDGRTYTWTHTGFWRPVWFWQDAHGTTLLTIKKNRQVELPEAASQCADLTLLALLGFYMVLLKEEEAAAAAASATV